MILGVLAAALVDSVFAGGPFQVGVVDTSLHEISGMVASHTVPDLYWAINDSGDEPVLYGMSDVGKVVRRWRLEGASNVDWEDIAYGPSRTGDTTVRYIYIADIGDNDARRSSIRIYAVSELPYSDTASARFTWQTLVYPDGPRDAETLLCDPRTGELFIVTKRERRNRLYRVPVPTQGTDTLQFVAELPFMLATAGDVSPDGSMIVVKNYMHTFAWRRGLSESIPNALTRTPQTITYMPEPQGEAIAFSADGDAYLTASERNAGDDVVPVYAYPLAATAREADRMRDVRRPQLSVAPLPKKKGWYTLRYTVPGESSITMYVRNVLGVKARIIADMTLEAGLQERDVDLSMLPAGDYVLVLRTRDFYQALPFAIVAH
jgi:hypothetical protein